MPLACQTRRDGEGSVCRIYCRFALFVVTRWKLSQIPIENMEDGAKEFLKSLRALDQCVVKTKLYKGKASLHCDTFVLLLVLPPVKILVLETSTKP